MPSSGKLVQVQGMGIIKKCCLLFLLIGFADRIVLSPKSNMVQRITYRQQLSYNTKTLHYLKKGPYETKCPMAGLRLKGNKPLRSWEHPPYSLRHQKAFRANGGVFSHKAECKKNDCAFLIEDLKVLKAEAKATKEQVSTFFIDHLLKIETVSAKK